MLSVRTSIINQDRDQSHVQDPDHIVDLIRHLDHIRVLVHILDPNQEINKVYIISRN